MGRGGGKVNPKKIDWGGAHSAKRHSAGSAHGMTAMVEAEGMNRRSPAALTGAGDASASRDITSLTRTR